MKFAKYFLVSYMLLVLSIRIVSGGNQCNENQQKCATNSQGSQQNPDLQVRYPPLNPQSVSADDQLIFYDPEGNQTLDATLSSCERQLAQCQGPECDRERLENVVYHTIPEKLHAEYIENQELKDADKTQRMLDVLLINIQNTELVAYPHKSDYEDEPALASRAIEPMNSKFPSRVKFDPDILDLGIRPIGISHSETVTITNYGKNEDLVIMLVLTDTQWLEVTSTEKVPIRVSPGNSVKFQITHTPISLGNSTAYLLLKLTNSKSYLYKVKVFGVENSFGLRPINLNIYNPGVPNRLQVYMRNPFPTENISLYCVQIPDRQIDVLYNSDEYYEPTCCSCNPFITIPPLKQSRVFDIVFTVNSANIVYTILRIKGIPNFNITLPVIIKATTGNALISPRALDFGTVSLGQKPHRIMVKLDTSSSPVTVTGPIYKPSPNFALYFPALRQHSAYYRQSPTPSTIGYVAFQATRAGVYESHLFIHTNGNEATKLVMRATVVDRALEYNVTDVSIDVTGKSAEQMHTQQVYLTSAAKEVMAFTRAEIDQGDFKAEIACYSNDTSKKCAKVVYPGQRDGLLLVHYQHTNNTQYPLTTYASLLATNSLFHVPITFFDTNLFCTYSEYLPDSSSEEPVLVHRKCNEIELINLGIFADETKVFSLNITNENPVNVTLSRLSLQHKTTPCCFEITGIYDASTGEQKRGFVLGKIHGLQDGEELVIPSNSAVTLIIYLSLDDCSRGSNVKTADGDSFTNWLIFQTGGKETKMRLHFRYHSGEFSFSPSRMRFEPGFVGTYQSKELRAISTFRVPLNIRRTWTSDERVELKLSIKQIMSESKTEVGIVTFAPGNTPEEQRFLSLQSKIVSWSNNAISLKELKLWREQQMMWDRISSLGGTIIDAQIYMDTDILQHIKLPVKAELTQPILVQENEVNFGLIQNGTSKQMTIQIYNPSVEPLIIQLFAADSSMANYKSALPIYFAPTSKCSGNYTTWMGKYAVTTRQLRRKEKLTEYRSYADFVDEYCCYTGRYNVSLLYAPVFESVPDDPQLSPIEHCDSKPVVQTNLSAVEGQREKERKNSLLSAIYGFFTQRHEPPSNGSLPVPVVSGYFSFPSTFSQYPLIVDALSYFTIGPITYNPQSTGEHAAMVFIKNNLTVLYPIKLKGESGVGTIEFVEENNLYLKSKRTLNVIPKEHISLRKATNSQYSLTSDIELRLTRMDLVALSSKEEDENSISNLWSLIVHYLGKLDSYDYKAKTVHERTFVIKNSGNMPLTVTDMSIDGHGCSAHDLTIQNCEGFTLKPQETYVLSLEYVTKLAVSYSKHSLTFATLSGPQTFGFSVNLPFNLLYVLQRLPAIERQ